MKKNKNILGKELSKFTKVALSGLMVVTCAHFSYVSAEDTEETNTEEVITEVTQVEETPEQEVVEEISTETEGTVAETSNEEVTSTPETTVVETTDEPEVTETIVATEEPYEIVMPETKEETEQDEEVKLDEMTSDELFNYIMSIGADELDALYDEYPNLDNLMANFTEEEQEALANKFGNAEEDIELAEYKEGNDATFKTSISNAEVAYFAWHETSDTTGDITFTTVPNEALTIKEFTTKNTWHEYGKPGYVLFFVKTDSEHLVTGLGTSGNGDVFPIDTTDWGNISGYPGLSNVIAAAKKAKYEVAFGYSASAGETKTGSFEIVGQKPKVSVAASTTAVNVKPNQQITFNITITPEVLSRTEVTGVAVTSAEINGQKVIISDLVKQSDGSYTGSVNYTVTQTDCDNGSVALIVNTSTGYKANVKSQGQGGTLYTTSTIIGTATTSCSIAEKSNVNYEFVSGTTGKELPSDVMVLLPSETSKYYVDDTVYALDVQKTRVDIDTADEHGYWTFKGWNKTSATMTKDGVTFIGTWEYIAKKGTAGYYLSLSNATWSTPTGISAFDEDGKTKYYYDKKFAYGDTFIVESKEPTAEGYQFIGWLDKKRNKQAAAIRNVGETVTYTYKDDSTYTLDALWASIAVTGTEVTYDGKSHTISSADIEINEGTDLKPEYKKQAKKLIEEGTISYSTDNVNWSTEKPTFTDAGTYTVYVREVVTLGGQAKTLVGKGTVKINPRPITITAGSYSKTYDGTELTKNSYEITSGSLVGSDAITSVTVAGTITDVGTVDNIASDAVISTGSKDNYKVTYVNGTLEITPASVTVKADNKTKTYGEADPTFTATVEGLLGEDTVSYTLSRNSGETVGTYTITASGKATQGNYTVTYETGTLTINPTEGMQVGTLTDVVYNGLEQKQSPTVTNNKETTLVENTDYTVSYSQDATNVGTVIVTVTGIGNYTGTVQRTYQITPKTLYVTTPSATKVYDGKALTKTEGASITGLVNGETATLNVTGRQVEVGYSANTYEIVWGTAKSSNYTVVGTDEEGHSTIGILTVTEYADAIVVTTTGGVFTYDGQAHGATVSVSSLPEGYTLETATSNATATDVTSEDVTATCDNLVIRNAENEDVTSKLRITKVNGTIEITPASLSVTTPDATKVYDGTALTAEGTVSGLVNNETVTFVTTGSQTDKGESSNTYTLVFANEEGASEDTNAKRSNYSISQNVGTLTVTAKSITPDDDKTPEKEKTGIAVNDPSNHVYDGKEHKEVLTVTDTKTDKTLVEGTDYEVSYDTEDFTNVHEITITVTGKGNYTGSFTKKYAITPAAVKVTADNKSKTQGESDPTFTATVEGLIGKDTVTYTLSRNSGETVGTYTITASGETTQGNYTVTYATGTLTITKGEEKKDDSKPTPTPTPSVNPGCPAGTVWNEDAKVCQTIVVPVTPTVNPTPNNPTPTVTPSETPEATASAEPEKSAEPTASASAETIVDPDTTPEVVTKGHWALINLVAAIVSVLLGIVLVLSKNKKDKDEDEEEQNEDENAEEAKRHKRWKVVSVIDAVLAVVVFIFTENMRLPMVLVDKWTMLMVLFALVSVISLVFGRKYHEEDEEDENQAQA